MSNFPSANGDMQNSTKGTSMMEYFKSNYFKHKTWYVN